MALADAEFVQGETIRDENERVICSIVYTSEGTAHYFPDTFRKTDCIRELESKGYSMKRLKEQTMLDIDWGICISLTEENGRV